MNKQKKTPYYFGMGIAYGCSFGGLFGTVFGEHMLVVFLVGIISGGLIGIVYGELNTKRHK